MKFNLSFEVNWTRAATATPPQEQLDASPEPPEVTAALPTPTRVEQLPSPPSRLKLTSSQPPPSIYAQTTAANSRWKQRRTGTIDISSFPRPSAEELKAAVGRHPRVWARLRAPEVVTKSLLSTRVTYERRKKPRRINEEDLLVLYSGAREILLHGKEDAE